MIALPSFRPAFFGALNPIAKAYADTVGLSAVQASALSRHLNDLTAAGIVPVQLSLGRSEWKARNGSSWRAVIGNATTITGTVTDAAEGQQFPGTAGNYARLNNPIQSAALTELGMVVVGRALTGTTQQPMLSGYSGASSRGPNISLNASSLQGAIANRMLVDFSGSSNANSIPGAQSQKIINSGGILALGADFVANESPYIYSGAWIVKSGNTPYLPTLFNNGATWSIGGKPDNTTSINGAISYALVSSSRITPDRYAALYSSALKHGIIQTEATSVLVGIGDSLMQGALPSNNTDNTLSHKLTFTATGGAWQNVCTAQNSGVGGSDITSVEGVQKTEALRWTRADGFTNRWIVHFGTHNDSAYESSSEATRNALMERYIAVWSELQSLGAKIAIVSPLDATGRTSEQYTARAAYRTRLATRCAEEGFAYVNLHADTDFSVASRNATYFIDGLHLSAAGYERATQLFVAAIASPSVTP
jgi:lysophospholipase L1-like esterase